MPIAAISAVQRTAAPQPHAKSHPDAALPAAPGPVAAAPTVQRRELPEAPRPLTPANAAVHIMKVPSSRVLEAFVSLQRALGQQAASQASPPPPRIDLEA